MKLLTPNKIRDQTPSKTRVKGKTTDSADGNVLKNKSQTPSKLAQSAVENKCRTPRGRKKKMADDDDTVKVKIV